MSGTSYKSEYAAEISQLTKAALQDKRRRGEYCGGAVPYGYRVSAEDTLMPAEQERQIIQRIQALAAQGVTYRTIIQVLTVDGQFTRSGKPFQPGQISRIAR